MINFLSQKLGFETIPVFRLYVSILKTLSATEETFFVCLFNSGVFCSTNSERFSLSDLCVFLTLGFYVLKTKFSFIEPHRYQYWTLFVLFFLWAFLSILHLLSTTPRVQSDVFYVSAHPPSDPHHPPLVFCRAGTISRSCSLGFYGNVWRIIPCCLGLSSRCCSWFQPAQVHGRCGDNTLLARKERGRGRAVVKVGAVLSFAICSCSGSNTYRSHSLPTTTVVAGVGALQLLVDILLRRVLLVVLEVVEVEEVDVLSGHTQVGTARAVFVAHSQSRSHWQSWQK